MVEFQHVAHHATIVQRLSPQRGLRIPIKITGRTAGQTETITTKWQGRGKTQDLAPVLLTVPVHDHSSDYLELSDSTERVLRNDKRGAISSGTEGILNRLDINEEQWLEMTSNFEGCFSSFFGGENGLRMTCENLHYQRPLGLATCKLMFRKYLLTFNPELISEAF